MAEVNQPTRQELIMYTPLEDVLAKDSWDEIDVEILVRNRGLLDADTLEKLGITKPKALSADEVIAKTEAIEEAAPVVEKAKKKIAKKEVVDKKTE